MTLFDLGAAQLALFTLYFARVSAFIFVVPLFSSRNAPPALKIALSFFLALIFITVNSPSVDSSLLDAAIYVPALITELGIGLILGFFVSFIFAAFHVAGEHIGYQMGFAVVNVFDFASQQQVSLVAQFLFTLAMLLFLNLNLHHGMIATWHGSLLLAPPGRVALAALSVADVVSVCQDFFLIAFQLAAPLMAFLILADISLGIIARIMPQMNVFFVGIPVKIAFGLFMLASAVMAYGVVLERGSTRILQDVLMFVKG